jgi:hypothetical protein
VDDDGLVFALTVFEGRERRAVAEVVTPFESPAAADAFARIEGIDAYAVGPVRFPCGLTTSASEGLR